MAVFPKANEGVPCHGYPLWAVNNHAPSNRAHQKMRPTKEVFGKLENAGLITKCEYKRLWKGDNA